MTLGDLSNAYSSHFVHKAKEIGPQSRVLVSRCKVTVLQANWMGSWRWPCGFVHCYRLGLWSSLGLVPNYVVLVWSNEGGGPHHTQGRHTRGLGIGLRKVVVLTLNIHQYSIEAKNNVSSVIPTCSPKADMIFLFIYMIHIVICMCNCLKCLFKHPLPYLQHENLTPCWFTTDSYQVTSRLIWYLWSKFRC